MNQKNKEKIQSRYTEFQLLSQQVSHLEEQLNNVGEQISELRSLKNNIDELRNAKNNTEILVHLGHNLFTKAKLINGKEFIIGIGGGVLTNKSSDGVVEFLSGHIKELEELSETMKGKISEANSTLQKLHRDLASLIEEK